MKRCYALCFLLNVCARTILGMQTFLPQKTCVVSLGSNCRVATWLRALKIRTQAYPFDWVESESLNELIQLIKNDFADYLKFERLAPSYNYFYNRIMDTTYKINFVHDFSFQGNERFSFANVDDYNHGIACFKQEYKKFYAKYMRRIQRFRSLTKNYEQVIFVRTLVVDQESAQKLSAALQLLFDNSEKIILIVIGDKEEFKRDWLMKGIKNFYLPAEYLITDGYEAAFKQILQEVLRENKTNSEIYFQEETIIF